MYYNPKHCTKRNAKEWHSNKLLRAVAEETMVCDEMGGYGAGQSEDEMGLN